jgi:hypothetical protein
VGHGKTVDDDAAGRHFQNATAVTPALTPAFGSETRLLR